MKSIYITFLFLLFSFCANAQTISVGARVGVNIANQKVEINGLPIRQQPKNIQVLDVAIPIAINFSEKFAIQPEFHFTQKGELAEFLDASFQDLVSIECRYNYFEIPLLAKIRFESRGGVIYVLGGPFVSYGLGGTEFITIGDQSEENEIDFEDKLGFGIERKYDRVDFGFTGGVGLEYLLNSGSVVFDVRYSRALDNVFEETMINEMQTLTTQNFGIAVSIGYMHDFGKKKKKKRKDIDDDYGY